MVEIERTDITVEEVEGAEDVDEYTHLRTSEPVQVQIGESAGNPILVEAQHFVAASVEGVDEYEVNPLEAAMSDGEYEAGEVVTQEFDEASVFVSNEDGDLGGGVVQVDGGSMQDAIDEFVEEHL